MKSSSRRHASWQAGAHWSLERFNDLVEAKVPEANRMLLDKGIGRLEGAKRIP